MDSSGLRLLVPVKKLRVGAGRFHLPKIAVFATSRVCDSLALGQLVDDLAGAGRCKGRIVYNAFGEANIRIGRAAGMGDQAYRIVISKDDISVTAGGDAGAYYAVQTLRDIFKSYSAIPCCEIIDGPDFVRRGVYLDCSRGKVPKLATLKGLVERLAHWKINELQLYIENVFAFVRHPAIGKGHSPFTAEELIELQEFCERHYVRLVGSLASLGHMEKILMLDEYKDLGEMPGYRFLPGGTTLCPGDRRSIKLVGELYEEFVPIFKAVDFNVCGDEPWELGQGRSKGICEKRGKGVVYAEFIKKLYELCQKHGKRMNMWGDIVLEHPETLKMLPKDIVMLNWEYNAGGERVGRSREISDARFELVVCPGTSGWNTHGTRLENAILNVAQFAKVGIKNGATGLLNTDWGDNGHRNLLGVSLHGFAHGAAHGWNSRAVDDGNFTKIFCEKFFGAKSGVIERMIKDLGATYKRCGAPYVNESAFYYAFYEPMVFEKGNDPYRADSPVNRSRIDSITQKGLVEVIESLLRYQDESLELEGMADFEAIAMLEYRMALSMDLFTAKRAMLAKAIRSGESVPAGHFKEIANEAKMLGENFKGLWLERNRTSRLGDNSKLFKQVEREAIKYSKK